MKRQKQQPDQNGPSEFRTFDWRVPAQSGMIREQRPAEPPVSAAPGRDRIKIVISYVFRNYLWMSIAMIWYFGLLFRSLEHQTLEMSRTILWALTIGFTLAGIILWIRRNRSGITVFFNVVTGFGIYTVFAYARLRPALIRTTLIITGCLFVLAAALIIFRRSPLRMKLRSVVTAAHMVAGFGCAVIIIIAATPMLSGNTLITPSVRPAVSGQTIGEHMETLSLLYSDSWETLPAGRKLDVLQTVANIERASLGLPHELNVGVDNLDEGTAGHYRDDTHEIIIDTDSLLNDDAWELVDTVCHEAYHGYEHRMVDLYRQTSPEARELAVFDGARRYEAEFDHPVHGHEDFDAYYQQHIERDARTYADEATMRYKWEIYAHLHGYASEDGYSYPEYREPVIIPAVDIP